MKARVLTQAFLDLVKATDKEVEVSDAKVPGLRYAVQPAPSNARSWLFRFRWAGKSAQHTIGKHPPVGLRDARDLARQAALDVARGIDPRQARRAAKAAAKEAAVPKLDLFEAVAAQFIKDHAKVKTRPRSWKESERLLREVVAAWPGKRIGEIERSDVKAVLRPIVARAPVVGNRTLGTLHTLFQWAVREELVAVNPCSTIEPPAQETSRDRVLTTGEVEAFWRATGEIAYPFGPLARLLLLTGARLREVATMQWSEVNIEARLWTVPASKAKNRHDHQIPLSRQALAILVEDPDEDLLRYKLPRFKASDFLFSVDGHRPVNGFTRWKKTLDEKMAPATPFTLHDLRRTFASNLAELEIPPHVIEAALNHKSGTIKGVAAVYNKYSYLKEKASALQRWADVVEPPPPDAEAGTIVNAAERFAARA